VPVQADYTEVQQPLVAASALPPSRTPIPRARGIRQPLVWLFARQFPEQVQEVRTLVLQIETWR